MIQLPTQLLVASGNAGKLAEFRQLFAPLGVEVVGQRELGITDPEETGLTFVENALIKARHACRESGLTTLADDSGLCVDALNGAPGLYSARYAGAGGDAGANVVKLLSELNEVPVEQRGGHFVCVLVLLLSPCDPDPLIASGRWAGRIATTARGEAGFGYDPIFVDSALGQTAAEMSSAEKHARSHRGIACRSLMSMLGIQPAGLLV